MDSQPFWLYSSCSAMWSHHVEVFIPACRLDGLIPSDLYFEADDSSIHDCSSFESHNSTHYRWLFGYDDCGMTVLNNETHPEYVKYRTWLKTHIDLDGLTYPYMPVIDMPLECTVFVEVQYSNLYLCFSGMDSTRKSC